jgi:hypothetical protein
MGKRGRSERRKYLEKGIENKKIQMTPKMVASLNSKNSQISSNTPKSTASMDNKSPACTICLDNMTKPSKVNGCEHMFCRDCIDPWAAVSNSCPLCKKEFKKIYYYDSNVNKIIYTRNVKKKKFKYEEEENENWIENTLEHCMKCKNTDDVYLMLVCDKCKFNVCHTYCAGLDLIPDEDWFCSECNPVKPDKKEPIKKSKKLRKIKNSSNNPDSITNSLNNNNSTKSTKSSLNKNLVMCV